MFLRNVGLLSTDCTSLYPRRYLFMNHAFVDKPPEVANIAAMDRQTGVPYPVWE
jgi:hypothetical protein